MNYTLEYSSISEKIYLSKAKFNIDDEIVGLKIIIIKVCHCERPEGVWQSVKDRKSSG